jgi:hypothetical protein
MDLSIVTLVILVVVLAVLALFPSLRGWMRPRR